MNSFASLLQGRVVERHGITVFLGEIDWPIETVDAISIKIRC